MQRRPDPVRNRHAFPHRTINKHMYEETSRARLVVTFTKQSNFVAHGAVAEFGDAQARVHGLGECEAFLVSTARIHRETNDGGVVNIEASDADQVFVDDGVEPAVVDDVIDVTVNVVVHPAGGDGEAVFVVGARHLRIVGAAKVAKVLGSPPSLASTFFGVENSFLIKKASRTYCSAFM